jgi:hypothetical protein
VYQGERVGYSNYRRARVPAYFYGWPVSHSGMAGMSMWELSHRADSLVVPLADRHYTRQKVGSPQFVPPGRCLVLRTPDLDAYWVTSWPFAEYVKHAWPGAWVCSAFRNEAPHKYLSSDLIREAVAITCWYWPDVPTLGMVTFVDQQEVRRKRDWGRCYRRAGWTALQETTKAGLFVLQLRADQMPEPVIPIGAQLELVAA